MYILKNAYLNIIRSKGRNILIGIIITVITIGSCITIAINKSGYALVESYKSSNPLEVSFNLDTMSFRDTTDEEKENFNLLTLEDIENIGSLDEVNSYYYTLESSLNSDTVTAISYEDLFTKPSERENNDGDTNFMPNNRGMGMNKPNNFLSGDFQITAYSDISYNEDFISGSKSLLEGEMITKDNTDNVIVISEELALENSIEVGDKLVFINTNDETITYELEVIGIYSVSEDENVMNPMASVTSNQIYTNITALNQILEDNGEVSDYMASSSITSKFYVDYEDLESFEVSAREIGVSEYYKITTNEDEVTKTLEPIKNISNFSFTFLIIILIVGGIVLTIINLFNIRERKYEIGVLRAIGMTKSKVTVQLVSEIFIIALVSLIIGTGIASVLSQPVSNYILKNEIESTLEQSENIANNFGSGDFQRPGFGGQMSKGDKINPMASNVDYVDALDVQIDFTTIIELFGVSLTLTIISGVTAVMFVNKYEPNKILQNRG